MMESIRIVIRISNLYQAQEKYSSCFFHRMRSKSNQSKQSSLFPGFGSWVGPFPKRQLNPHASALLDLFPPARLKALKLQHCDLSNSAAKRNTASYFWFEQLRSERHPEMLFPFKRVRQFSRTLHLML